MFVLHGLLSLIVRIDQCLQTYITHPELDVQTKRTCKRMTMHSSVLQASYNALLFSVCADLRLALWYWREIRGERRALQQESRGEVLFAKSPQAPEDLAALPVYIPATPFERCSNSEGSDIGTFTDHLQSTYTAFYMH